MTSNTGSAETLDDQRRLLIERWLAEFAAVAGQAHLADPDHKWRATSAWQKAIRRGNSDAARWFVAALWNHDPKYVLYRLPIILLEEVGLGDPALVLAGMAACGSKGGARRGLELASMLTERAAAAVKDRSSCDLVVATERLIKVDPVVGRVFRASDLQTRKDVFLDRSRSPFERMSALWSLAGTTKYPGDDIRAANPISRDELAELIPHGFTRDLWTVGTGAMRDALPLGAILTAEYWAASASAWAENEATSIPPDELLAGYPASTYDQFTREGKRAIAHFLRASRPWRHWVSQYTPDRRRQKDITARFLFRVESGLVNRRLRYEPGSRLITEAPLLATAQMFGIPAAEVQVGKRLLIEQLPVLTQARRRVLEGEPSGADYSARNTDESRSEGTR
ncbi:MAG: hypothetical protein ABSC46_04000 [Candidatus Limnocylindrales bacterium]|jgi:hypothetical protein